MTTAYTFVRSSEHVYPDHPERPGRLDILKPKMDSYNADQLDVSPASHKEIGLVHDPPDFYVVAPNMYNVPKRDFQSWTYPNPGPVHPEQFFFGKKK